MQIVWGCDCSLYDLTNNYSHALATLQTDNAIASATNTIRTQYEVTPNQEGDRETWAKWTLGTCFS